jgi:hypothetical protein
MLGSYYACGNINQFHYDSSMNIPGKIRILLRHLLHCLHPAETH